MTSIKFLSVISMLCKTEWSWELRTWSHKMNLFDVLSTSPHYFWRKWIGAANENSNFDLRVERVKIKGGYDKYPWSAASHTHKKTVDIMFGTVIHKGTNKKSFIYSAASLTNKFQQNLMNVPNYCKHSTYQNGKKQW